MEVEVFTDRWFTDEQLPSYQKAGDADGYVYRAEPQPDSLPLPARIGSKRTSDLNA